MQILVNYEDGHAAPKIMSGFITGLRRLGHEVHDFAQER